MAASDSGTYKLQELMATPIRTEPSNTRIRRYGFVADILINHSAKGDTFHYIILREGSPAVVRGGREASMEKAVECVEEFLKKYDQPERKPS